ncbi:MAG TPA: sporulation protein YqfD [Tissierellales bacterium]|nr:sporulation protein YqfD [Tissierellales bacterium]
MLAIKLWNYFKGYVIIKVEGLTLEKFLNLAANSNIYIWDIKRMDYTLLEMKVSIKGFRELKKIANKGACRVYIKEKIGFPFFMNKLKKRKMLGFGFIIFLGLIFFLTSFIWEIEVSGNEITSNEDILELLENIDVKCGTMKYNVNKDQIKDIILDEIDALSFVNVEVKGTKLIIEIKEQDLPPKAIGKDTPCHIVAKKKGVVVKIVAKNGKGLVKEGDIVKEGQTLISGIIEDEEGENSYSVHSEGEVLAITRYSHQMEEPYIKVVEEETGRVHAEKEIKIGEKNFRLSKGEIPFDKYVEDIEEKKLINKDINLPIKLIVHNYKEVRSNEIKRNLEGLKESTQIKGVEEINKKLSKDAETVSKDVKYFAEDDKLITIVVLEVMEDIGKKQIITNGED